MEEPFSRLEGLEFNRFTLKTPSDSLLSSNSLLEVFEGEISLKDNSIFTIETNLFQVQFSSWPRPCHFNNHDNN